MLNFFKANALSLLLVSLVFGIAGVGLYYGLPVKYVASGSMYVKRAIEDGKGTYFTYEGYYNQQTAIAYTNTVMGLLESVDIRSKALQDLNMKVNEFSLRKLGKQVKVKKTGNQLITLNVTGASPQYAQALWTALALNTVNTAETLNKDSDRFLTISLVNQAPVVKEAFRNVWLNFFAGVGLGFLSTTMLLGVKTYLKEQK